MKRLILLTMLLIVFLSSFAFVVAVKSTTETDFYVTENKPVDNSNYLVSKKRNVSANILLGIGILTFVFLVILIAKRLVTSILAKKKEEYVGRKKTSKTLQKKNTKLSKSQKKKTKSRTKK